MTHIESLTVFTHKGGFFWMCSECKTKKTIKHGTPFAGTIMTLCKACNRSTKHVICTNGKHK